MDQGFDLTKIISGMIENVPLWGIALLFVKRWLKNQQKSENETKQAIFGIHEKLNRIEVKLASSGIDDLKDNIERLKESRTKTEMNIDALWRSVDKQKRTS